jgi:branched-chain amino acid transport system ATP-binding protein
MTDPVLSVRGISKSFGALKASDDVNLDLLPGEIHALIGPNGAGKSTLIQQIAGSLQPDAGHIQFLGQDVTALNTIARAQIGLGRTFQISSLAMEDTVLQNAMLGALGAHGKPFRFFRPVLKDRDLRGIAEMALKRVNLLDHATMRTSELSHGQRRQLEVAVALTLSPKAFVMDEPMAGLGTSGSQSLTTFLDELRHEAPILLVEHDMDAVFALADRISVLVYGKIIATGSVDEIRAHPEVRRAYLGEDA